MIYSSVNLRNGSIIKKKTDGWREPAGETVRSIEFSTKYLAFILNQKGCLTVNFS